MERISLLSLFPVAVTGTGPQPLGPTAGRAPANCDEPPTRLKVTVRVGVGGPAGDPATTPAAGAGESSTHRPGHRRRRSRAASPSAVPHRGSADVWRVYAITITPARRGLRYQVALDRSKMDERRKPSSFCLKMDKRREPLFVRAFCSSCPSPPESRSDSES
jgi:hypothetical protein